MHESTLPPRRRYAPELKLEIVQEALAGKRSKAAIARKHDINANQVSNWIREYRNNACWVEKARIPMLPVVLSKGTRHEQCRFNRDVEKAYTQSVPQLDSSVLDIQLTSGHRLSFSNPNEAQLHLILKALA
jgi:transposase